MGFIEYIQRSLRALVSVCMYMCVYNFKPLARYTYKIFTYTQESKTIISYQRKEIVFAHKKPFFISTLEGNIYTTGEQPRTIYASIHCRNRTFLSLFISPLHIQTLG